MAAPIGNEFWKMRSKHGRDKIFSTPGDMLEAAYEYFEWNENNPWYKREVIKSGDRAGDIIEVPTERPLTLDGLTSFWGVNRKYLDDFEKGLKEGEEDFSRIITHIREVVYRHKFEGAAVGAFTPAIMIRELGLKDKSEITGDGGSPLHPPAVVNIHPVAATAPILEDENDIENEGA